MGHLSDNIQHITATAVRRPLFANFRHPLAFVLDKMIPPSFVLMNLIACVIGWRTWSANFGGDQEANMRGAVSAACTTAIWTTVIMYGLAACVWVASFIPLGTPEDHNAAETVDDLPTHQKLFEEICAHIRGNKELSPGFEKVMTGFDGGQFGVGLERVAKAMQNTLMANIEDIAFWDEEDSHLLTHVCEVKQVMEEVVAAVSSAVASSRSA